MSSTPFPSQMTGAQIENALNKVNGLIAAANNGKILCVDNGSLAAKSAIEIQGGTIDELNITSNGTYTHAANGGYNPVVVNVPGSAVIQPLNVSQNGTFNPPSGVNGYAPVTVNVSGGSSGGNIVALIPEMTSDTTPSGVASADSVYSSQFQAYKAFDRLNSTRFAPENSQSINWLQYQFDTPKCVKMISIKNTEYGADFGSLYFRASNDGSNWTDLASNFAFDDLSNNGSSYKIINNSSSYLYYRLELRNKTTLDLTIKELQMFGLDGQTQETYGKKTEWALALWLDAIENVGKGSSHSSSATNWVNLADNSPCQIYNGTWNTNNLVFDGSSTWVNCGFKDLKTCTIEVLLSFDTVTQSDYGGYVAGNWDSGGYGIAQYNGKNEFESYVTYWRKLEGNSAQVNTPIVLTGVSDGSKVKLFENGIKVTEVSAQGIIGTPANSTIFAVGGNPRGSVITDGWFKGKVYSVRVYNVALSDSVVSGLANELKAKYNV